MIKRAPVRAGMHARVQASDGSALRTFPGVAGMSTGATPADLVRLRETDMGEVGPADRLDGGGDAIKLRGGRGDRPPPDGEQ